MSAKNLTPKKIITVGLMTITTIMVGLSGLMKVIHLPWSVDGLAKTNLPNSATTLGLMEISFIILFAFPKTMRIGFLLISCYFAGAIGTELSHDGSIFNPAVPLTLVWICAFLRDRSVFFGIAESTTN
jgi:DoxX-like family